MALETNPAPVLTPGRLYIAGDRIVCAEARCAGQTALYTGHSTGGSRLVEVGEAERAAWPEDLGEMTCEHLAYA